MKSLSFDVKKLSLFKTLRSKYLGILYHISLPVLMQMSGCLKATTHLTNTPTSTEITLTTEYTSNNNTMVVKNEHSLIVPNDSDEETINESHKLPFEEDPQFQKLSPCQKKYIFVLRRKTQQQRVTSKRKAVLSSELLIIIKAFEQLEEIRKRRYNGEQLNKKELNIISGKYLSDEKIRQLQKELKEQEVYDDIISESKKIISLKKIYLKTLPKSYNSEIDFYQNLIVSGAFNPYTYFISLTLPEKIIGNYIKALTTKYYLEDKVYFNSKVSRGRCEFGSYTVVTFLIPLLYIIVSSATEYNIFLYYKCYCPFSCDYDCDNSICSPTYYRSMEECQINELKESIVEVCINTTYMPSFLIYLFTGASSFVLFFPYLLYRTAQQYTYNKILSRQNKLMLEANINAEHPERLTILPKPYEPSSCCKSLVCNKTIVEFSNGSKISKVCGCIELPFSINFSKFYSKITGCFNWMFCANQQEETSNQEIVDLIINSFE